jgi:hypothetical protein
MGLSIPITYLKIQYMRDETKEIRKAKARNARVPLREIAGIVNKLDE